MKAIVENPLMNCEPESMDLFVQILNEITSSHYEDEVRVCMNCLCQRVPYLKLCFKYGFGKNYMWVTQSNYSGRLILVEF